MRFNHLLHGLPFLLALFLSACGGGGGSTATVITPGAHSIAAAISTSVPATTCPTGGIAVNTGIDSDGNGVLDASEISNTQYVCNGAAAANALMAVGDEPAGANCAAGGKKIGVGLDTDNNGTLDVAEITSSSYICNGTSGANGLNTLVSASGEALGVNCVFGGIKVNSGLDSNSNGTLDAAEITSTSYACNVTAGSGGFAWVDVTASSVQAASNMGYMADSASQVTVTLPAAPVAGDVVKLTGIGAGGWNVAANAGQSIITSSINGNPVPSGSISGVRGDSIELLYAGNSQFTVLSYTGNLSIVFVPAAPTASVVEIGQNGSQPYTGDTLTGYYSYTDVNNDPEGASTFRWLRNGIAITDATATTYTLVAADVGSTITFEVTPVSTVAPATGVAVTSSATSTVLDAPIGQVSQGGLTWMQVTFMDTWINANAYCTNTTINGLTGWRLPTQAELSALYTSGAMNGQGWTLTVTWSSMQYSAGLHYSVNLYTGGVDWGYDTGASYVSCVR